MTEKRPQLFRVECRPRGGGQAETFIFFVPALEIDEAIRSAQTSARKARAVEKDLSDAFQDYANLEVRVGSFGPGDPPELEFGEWLPFQR